MEPCDGIELQLPAVSPMPSLHCSDAFGFDCPGFWCGELSLSSALQACWDPVGHAHMPEVANSVPSLLHVARWGQQLVGDSQAPASAGAPANGAGQCPVGHWEEPRQENC